MRRKIGYTVKSDTLTFAKVRIGQFFIRDEDILFKLDDDRACTVASENMAVIGSCFDFYHNAEVDEILVNPEIVWGE